MFWASIALLLGDCERALEAEAQADAVGKEIGDPHLQTFAAWTTGWAQATRGEWEASIAARQRGLASAPDPLNTAFALGCLGYAYLEKGDLKAAMPCLEQASEHMRQLQYRRLEGLYTTWLGEAYCLYGDVDRARDRVRQGLTMAEAATYRIGIGWAQRTLGKIAQASGALAEAERHWLQALDVFAAMPARFEAARTHLALAELAQQQDNREVASGHLTEAHRLFTALRASTYTERTAQRAQALGLSLAADTVVSRATHREQPARVLRPSRAVQRGGKRGGETLYTYCLPPNDSAN